MTIMTTFIATDGNLYTTILTSTKCKLTTYNGTGGKIKIDYVYDNATNARYSVTEIDSGTISAYAFKSLAISKKLFEVEFPLVTTIGDYAFYNCFALTSAHFPKAITIGDNAFYNCSALTSAHFPLVTTLGNYVFILCIALTSAHFPKAITIGGFAFSSCYALTSARFPKAITIGDSAFSTCYTLTSAHFPLVTTLGVYAFNSCYTLTSAHFPLVTTLGDHAFSNCYALTSAHFPLVTTLGDYAFSSCYTLTSAHFPLVTTLGDYAFRNSYILQEVSIPSLPSSVNDTSIFTGLPNITHVYIGDISQASTYATNLGLNVSVFKQYCPPEPYCNKLKILVPCSVGILLTCGYIYNRMQKTHISSKIKKHKHKRSPKITLL